MTDRPNKHVTPFLLETLGEIDHTRVDAPYLRMVNMIRGSNKNDWTYLYDIRFTQPNTEHIDMASVHSLEHLLATALSRHLDNFVNFGCMGCQTGFYLTVMNQGDYDVIATALNKALEDTLAATEVPLCNIYTCGWAANHDLAGAQERARTMLSHKENWRKVFQALDL